MRPRLATGLPFLRTAIPFPAMDHNTYMRHAGVRNTLGVILLLVCSSVVRYEDGEARVSPIVERYPIGTLLSPRDLLQKILIVSRKLLDFVDDVE